MNGEGERYQEEPQKGSGVSFTNSSGMKDVRRSHLLKTACQGKGIAPGSLGNGHDMKEADSGSP